MNIPGGTAPAILAISACPAIPRQWTSAPGSRFFWTVIGTRSMRVTIIRGIGRIVIARGRDAADVAISTTFGSATLARFTVVTDEVVDEANKSRTLETAAA